MPAQLSLKELFNLALEVVGFENWLEGMLAGYLLDEQNSVLAFYAENKLELQGIYDGEWVRIRIHWEHGKQPRVEETHREAIDPLFGQDEVNDYSEIEQNFMVAEGAFGS